jgi:hypothetical protein
VSEYYKILVGGKSCNGGSLKWSLPKQNSHGSWKPGRWHRVKGEPTMCRRGIHVVKDPYQQWWRWGADVYRVETGPIVAEEQDKALTMSCRLLSVEAKPAWLIAAEQFVISIKDVPFFKPDGQPRSDWNLFTAPTWAAARDAARDASWAAARDAAWAASWAAAWAASWAAAWAASRAAAGAAAWDAAWAAAWAASRAAAWAASLMADVIVAELSGPHAEHAKARWEVWQKGYALLCDVNGVLCVYAKDGAK